MGLYPSIYGTTRRECKKFTLRHNLKTFRTFKSIFGQIFAGMRPKIGYMSANIGPRRLGNTY